ncbi:MAG TPA: type II secretion system F family protein [Acidimicrobiales bacterium]|nr:type II secretion system F family protein [Acidimicrobiales bacterium]
MTAPVAMATAAPVQMAAAGLVGLGAALTAVGFLLRLRRRERSLAAILDLSWGEHDVPVEAVSETPSMSALTDRLAELAGSLDRRGSLHAALERAGLPVRPGEYLLISAVAAVAVGGLLGAVTASWPIGVMGLVGAALGARRWPSIRAGRRARQLEAQLPAAFSLWASSMAAGHTFLRSVQMLREECRPPLAEELDRVVAETMLGQELVDALGHMADRYDIADLRWAVQAVRVQRITGGKLSEILHTLAGFMLTRQEVRREVQVLSAEGRISAYVLVCLPVVLGLVMQVVDPAYLRPFFSGLGLVALGVAAGMLVTGFVIIRRMVNIRV